MSKFTADNPKGLERALTEQTLDAEGAGIIKQHRLTALVIVLAGEIITNDGDGAYASDVEVNERTRFVLASLLDDIVSGHGTEGEHLKSPITSSHSALVLN